MCVLTSMSVCAILCSHRLVFFFFSVFFFFGGGVLVCLFVCLFCATFGFAPHLIARENSFCLYLIKLSSFDYLQASSY